MNRIAIAVVFALTTHVHAQSGDWVQYGKDAQGDTYWVHSGRIKQLADKRFEVWTEHRYQKSEPVWRGKGAPVAARAVRLLEVNCEAMTLKGLNAVFYDRPGRVVHTALVPGDAEPVVPGSTGESLAEIFCK